MSFSREQTQGPVVADRPSGYHPLGALAADIVGHGFLQSVQLLIFLRIWPVFPNSPQINMVKP
jgi:hypothetical protein